jgi:dihydroneopterin aldolase
MDKIVLKNVRCYSYHGCLKEESVIGSDYLVNLSVYADLNKSVSSDQLIDTIDYVLLNKIIKTEMAVPSKLLETVADRIVSSAFKSDSRIKKCVVKVSKINPPINGDVEKVSVKLSRKK